MNTNVAMTKIQPKKSSGEYKTDMSHRFKLRLLMGHRNQDPDLGPVMKGSESRPMRLKLTPIVTHDTAEDVDQLPLHNTCPTTRLPSCTRGGVGADSNPPSPAVNVNYI